MACPPINTVGTVSLPLATLRTFAASAGLSQMLCLTVEMPANRRPALRARQYGQPGRQYRSICSIRSLFFSGELIVPSGYDTWRPARRRQLDQRRFVGKADGDHGAAALVRGPIRRGAGAVVQFDDGPGDRHAEAD